MKDDDAGACRTRRDPLGILARGLCAAALPAAIVLLGGCATTQKPDPLEKYNRKVFAFNEDLDTYVIAPPSRVYKNVVPQPVRQGIGNFFDNLRDAWSAVNLVLQGRPTDSVNDLMRFSINTVIGIGGVFDWGTKMGLMPHREDFGQTLGVWGVPAGAYLMLPLLGPSTARDVVGLPVDIQASPDQIASKVPLRNTLTAVRIVNKRAELFDATNLIDEVALDKYSFVRDAYLQRRRALVEDGRPRRGGPVEEDYVPDAPPAAASAASPAASAADKGIQP